MSRRASSQLAYAANFGRSTMIYGTKLDVAAAHLEIERAARERVVFCDQRTVMNADAVARELGKSNKIHIAVDWIITPEIVAVLRRALADRSRRIFTVLSSCVTVPNDLGCDLREVFPVLIAWDEVL
jgi:hypothetical protein